jgi:hypothetical protein
MRLVASATLAILTAGSTLHAGPSPIAIRVRPAEGTAGHIIVGKAVRVDVSIRGELPPGELRWELIVQEREAASGDIGRLEEGVPIRGFHIFTMVDHQAFALGRWINPVGRPMASGMPPSLVRHIRFELQVREAEGQPDEEPGAIVAKATMTVNATCEAGDTDPACR